jgi:hypothetical protein
MPGRPTDAFPIPPGRVDDMRCGRDIFFPPIDLQPRADMMVHVMYGSSITKVMYILNHYITEMDA